MTDCGCAPAEAAELERRTLSILLTVNALMFSVEAAAGWWAESTGLLADSLDMFADASMYGTALYAAGRSRPLQASAAAASGVVQIILGLGVLFEVVRRTLYGSEPWSALMIGMGLLALAANVYCLLLLTKHREGGVHMRASLICSTNDVIANAGLIASGGLVMYFGHRLPDLMIGGFVAAIVIRGGAQILRESRLVCR